MNLKVNDLFPFMVGPSTGVAVPHSAETEKYSQKEPLVVVFVGVGVLVRVGVAFGVLVLVTVGVGV